MDKFGCTSPFGLNKTSICTDKIKAAKATQLFSEFTYFDDSRNQTVAERLCPRTCTGMMTWFSSFTKENNHNDGDGYLEIRFQKFIKVSRSRVAYGLLELLAEVGGYVGLFLGVSINQVISISRGLYGKLKAI